MESAAAEKKEKRKNEEETSSSSCKRRRQSGEFGGNISEQDRQENMKEAFTERNKDWRRLSFLEENFEAGGYKYVEEDNSGMIRTAVRLESAGVIAKDIDKKVNPNHGRRRRRSVALSKELDESITSSKRSRIGKESAQDENPNSGVSFNGNVADNEDLSIQAKRKNGTSSGLEDEIDGRGSSRKRLRSSDNGKRVKHEDQESATSSNQRHQEDGNDESRELGLPAETPECQWMRFRGMKSLGMSIVPYETELKSTERYNALLLTVMVGSAAAAQDPLQLSKKKLKITSTPTVTGNAATEAIQVPLDDIRAIQILPQPPIAPKFYSDRCARTELETWLWHPTDGTREMYWEKAQPGSWSLDCDGGFRKGAYGRYGSVIRNHEGREEVFVYGKSLVIMSPLFHELESIFETTKVAWSLGKKNISIRTDSKRAAHLLTMPNVYSTADEGYHVWNIVEKLKQYFWHNFRKEDGCSVHVRHQFRELNNLGDYVAGLATETTPTVVFGSFDDTTRYFLDWDIAGLPYYWDRDRKKAGKILEKIMREESLNK